MIALFLIVALFIPKDFLVEREVVINKPKSEVFEYVKYLKNQDDFSKWASMDPNMAKTYTGTDGSVGFVAAWDSKDKDVGAGEQEITGIIEGEQLDYELRFIKPMESKANAIMKTATLGEGQTKVTWGLSGHSGYPFNLVMRLMGFHNKLGDDLQIGLNNLKNKLENR